MSVATAARRLIAVSVLCAATFVVSPVWASTIKIGAPALIAPSAASTFYGSGTTSTDGLRVIHNATQGVDVATPRPPELIDLARALKNSPDLIYEYVHNNIETVWMYGLQKGALGAEIDKSGTSFDQAMLMVELLRQAGYTASYQAGTITLAGADFTAWSGISDATAACQMLASGGIPAAINGSTLADCSYGAGTSISSVKLAHAWVLVTISGSPYAFDPAFKAHTWKSGIQNLASAAGMTSGDPLNSVNSGMTSGTIGAHAEPYVKNLNASGAGGLNATLQGYASNLLTYFKNNNMQGAEIEDVVGGGLIVPYVSPPGGLRQASLSYADSGPTTWTGNIPNQYRTTLTVSGQMWDYNPCCNGGSYKDMFHIASNNFVKLYVDEIYGRRLSVGTDFYQHYGGDWSWYTTVVKLTLDATVDAPDTSDLSVLATYTDPQIDEGGGIVATSRGSPTNVTLAVDHPYAASQGLYMDDTVTKQVSLITALTIVKGFGETNANLFKKWGDERGLGAKLPWGTAPMCNNGEPCINYTHGRTGEFEREKTAASWLGQFTQANRLHSAIGNAVTQVHHVIGVVYGDATIAPTYPQGYTGDPNFPEADSFDRADLLVGMSVTNKSADAAKRRAVIHAEAASSAALEGSVAGEMGDLPDTASTASRFAWGNNPPASEDPSGAGARDFIQFGSNSGSDATDLPVAEAGVPNGDGVSQMNAPPEIGDEVSDWRSALSNAINLYAPNGFTVIASQEGFLGPGQRAGPISSTDNNQNGAPIDYRHYASKQRGSALVATKYTNGDPVEIDHVVTGPNNFNSGEQVVTKGGGGGAEPQQDVSYNASDPADILKTHFVDKSNAMGVNLSNGSVSYTAPAMVKAGTGGFPYELDATVSWHPGPPQGLPHNPSAPPNGWTSNWHNNLAISGSGQEAMGASDIRAAVGTIVAFLATQDIYGAAQSLKRDVAGVLAQAWWANQMSGNVATVTLGTSSRQFVKLPTGQWIAPGAGRNAQLTQSGTRVPYEEICNPRPPYAISRGWDDSGMQFTVTNTGGDVQTFQFWKNYYASTQDQACGVLKGFRLTDWVFPGGVKVNVVYGNSYMPNGGTNEGQGVVDEISEVNNSLGRKIEINMNEETFLGFNDGQAPSSAVTISTDAQGRTTITDAMTNVTAFGPSTVLPANPRPNAMPQLGAIFTADNLSLANVEYDYDNEGRVKQVRDAINLQIGNQLVIGGRNPYQFLIADGTRGERDDPVGAGFTVVYDTKSRPARYIDELGRETDAAFDGRGQVMSYTYPEGDQELFTYDLRNNPLTRTLVPKPGSAEAIAGQTIVASMTYPTSEQTNEICTHPKTCNKPVSSKRANGWNSYYSWGVAGNPTEGLLTKVQLPLDPDQNRPETDYGYDQFGTDGFELLTSKTQYIAKSPDVTVETDYAYQNSTLSYAPYTAIFDPTGLNQKTSFIYDIQGNLLQTFSPRTDVTATSIFTYDANRRRVYSVSPDPDGSGPHLSVATKAIYDPVGRVMEVDRGTATTSFWTVTGFTMYNWMKDFYDPASNKITETTGDTVGTNTAAQFAYDADNRVLCTARRMNPTVFGSLPPSACSLGASGNFGPDRITKMIYDAAGQARQEIRAFGTSLQEVYATHKYEPDGKEIAVADADAGISIGVSYADALNAGAATAHQTNYAYDGFDRLTTTTYADGTTDLVAIYDDDGNVKKRTTRAGRNITFSYDTNDRMSTKIVPASGAIPANTLSWTYDLMNEVLSLSDTNANTLTNTYDKAGRVLSAAQTMPGMSGTKTVSYQYDDGAGDKTNRSKVTWPDGYNVSYAYDAMNHMISATDSDSVALATYGYDYLARRTTLQYPNVNDNVSWSWSLEDDLASLNHNFYSAANDVGFTNTFTPAHQWATSTITGSTAFRYSVTLSGTDSYSAVNGLNEYTTVTPAGGVVQTTSYDTTGNLNCAGSACPTSTPSANAWVYTYDPENRLMTAGNGATSASYAYDPLGRRTTKTVNATVTNFLHDGDTEIAEYDSAGNQLRRFVPGSAIDEPIAMLTCITTACTGANATKTMFHSDKMGSVVAMSNASDGHLAEGPYIYDGYGNCTSGGSPCSAGEPYRYTGQRFDPETGLLYYRARYYSPALGRFLQTDPVGYKDDLNWYAYVGNDPTDKTDPTGESINQDIPDTATLGDQKDSDSKEEQSKNSQNPAGAQTANGEKKFDPGTPAKGHDENARPSTGDDHQQGDARRLQDRGREKADKSKGGPRRPPRVRPKDWKKGSWPPKDKNNNDQHQMQAPCMVAGPGGCGDALPPGTVLVPTVPYMPGLLPGMSPGVLGEPAFGIP